MALIPAPLPNPHLQKVPYPWPTIGNRGNLVFWGMLGTGKLATAEGRPWRKDGIFAYDSARSAGDVAALGRD
ncbi:hypothetical protein V498_03689 [Pseudogymnoascus sp. VKM F-4517 (FW-2822)]|nr:hypothetical protein V498_03689 [Pseudogymnoascus sp. VKM F-4517 (FW-2822)]